MIIGISKEGVGLLDIEVSYTVLTLKKYLQEIRELSVVA